MRFRFDTPGTNPFSETGNERFIFCIWHDTMVIPVFAGKHLYTTALTSRHTDGSFVAEVLKFKHILSIRGSTSRISTGAIRDLIRNANTRHLVITPDGPRGPNRKLSEGIAFIASRTGRAVLPTAYACKRCWKIRGSWSDLVIPKPFAKVVLLVGAPMYIPEGLTTSQLRPHVANIQEAMDELNLAAENDAHLCSGAKSEHLLASRSTLDVK